MIRLEIKNYNLILTEKPQNYQHYHLEKRKNMNMLHVRKILPFDQRRVIEQATYFKLQVYLFSVRKIFRNKKTKTIKDQGKNKEK